MFSSLSLDTPIKELYGESFSWFFSFIYACRAIRYVVGGFFMAIYRMICMKNQVQGLKRQNQIMNQLMVLDWITMFFLVGFHFIGADITGTDSSMAFCRGHSMSMDQIIQKSKGTTQWQISVGIKFTNTAIFYCQVLIALEMVRKFQKS